MWFRLSGKYSEAVENLERALLELWREVFYGKRDDSDGTMFVEGKEGIFNALEIDSERASARPGGSSSIAAHARHLAYYASLTSNFIEGLPDDGDWPGSWSVQAVDEAAWQAIKSDVHVQYERLKKHIEAGAVRGHPDGPLGAIANVAHAAYHLGAINTLLQIV